MSQIDSSHRPVSATQNVNTNLNNDNQVSTEIVGPVEIGSLFGDEIPAFFGEFILEFDRFNGGEVRHSWSEGDFRQLR